MQRQVHHPHYGSEQQAKQAPLGSAEDPDVPYILCDAIIPADLHGMTTVVLGAFALAAETRYIYRFRDWHPAYHRACMRLAVERSHARAPRPSSRPSPSRMLMPTVPRPPAAVMPGEVASSPSQSGILARRRTKSAAPLLLWPVVGLGRPPGEAPLEETIYGTGDDGKKFNGPAHLDMNTTRALDVQRQLDAAKKWYIDAETPHGHGYVYLNLLATHPEWDGHSLGAANCRWGMEELTGRPAEIVTLMGSEVEFPLLAATQTA
ncbi:hypothetical protein DL769_003574 [Monosporascus sp. CRB-8-3]|nr:hypothetical protein DL769_003574 [Monosporascus sp. CRB-8-3]